MTEHDGTFVAERGWRKFFNPETVDIPTNKLVIHSEQRDVCQSHVKLLVDRTRKGGDLCPTPLVVVETDGDKYAVIDGQHRMLAAAEMNVEKLPCLVATRKLAPDEIFAVQQGCNEENKGVRLYTHEDLVRRLSQVIEHMNMKRTTKVSEQTKPTVSLSFANRMLKPIVDGGDFAQGAVKTFHIWIAFTKDEVHKGIFLKLLEGSSLLTRHWDEINKKYRSTPGDTMDVVQQIISGEYGNAQLDEMLGRIVENNNVNEKIANIMIGIKHPEVTTYDQFQLVIRKHANIQWDKISAPLALAMLRCKCPKCGRLRQCAYKMKWVTVANQFLKAVRCVQCNHLNVGEEAQSDARGEKRVTAMNTESERTEPPCGESKGERTHSTVDISSDDERIEDVDINPSETNERRDVNAASTSDKDVENNDSPQLEIKSMPWKREASESSSSDSSSSDDDVVSGRREGDNGEALVEEIGEVDGGGDEDIGGDNGAPKFKKKSQPTNKVAPSSSSSDSSSSSSSGDEVISHEGKNRDALDGEHAVESGGGEEEEAGDVVRTVSNENKNILKQRPRTGKRSIESGEPLRKRAAIIESEEEDGDDMDSIHTPKEAPVGPAGRTSQPVIPMETEQGVDIDEAVEGTIDENEKPEDEKNVADGAKQRPKTLEQSAILENEASLIVLDATAVDGELGDNEPSIGGDNVSVLITALDVSDSALSRTVNVIEGKRGSVVTSTPIKRDVNNAVGQTDENSNCRQFNIPPLENRCPSIVQMGEYYEAVTRTIRPSWMKDVSFVYVDARPEYNAPLLKAFNSGFRRGQIGTSRRVECFCICMRPDVEPAEKMGQLLGMKTYEVPKERLMVRFVSLSRKVPLGEDRKLAHLFIWTFGGEMGEVMRKAERSRYLDVDDLMEISGAASLGGNKLYLLPMEESASEFRANDRFMNDLGRDTIVVAHGRAARIMTKAKEFCVKNR